jgi:hypothetical protein
MGQLPKSPFAVILVAGAVAVAGCGDDQVSASELRDQANAACKTYNQKLAKVPDAKTVADIPKVLGQTQPLLDKLLADLKDIQAPDDLQSDYASFLKRADDSRKTLDQLRDAARARDGARLARVAQQAQSREADTDRVASRLGLATCAES